MALSFRCLPQITVSASILWLVLGCHDVTSVSFSVQDTPLDAQPSVIVPERQQSSPGISVQAPLSGAEPVALDGSELTYDALDALDKVGQADFPEELFGLPLTAALKEIEKSTGQKISIDVLSLKAAGLIRTDPSELLIATPIDNNVSFQSVYAVLRDAHLFLVLNEAAIEVTSEAKAQRQTCLVLHPISETLLKSRRLRLTSTELFQTLHWNLDYRFLHVGDLDLVAVKTLPSGFLVRGPLRVHDLVRILLNVLQDVADQPENALLLAQSSMQLKEPLLNIDYADLPGIPLCELLDRLNDSYQKAFVISLDTDGLNSAGMSGDFPVKWSPYDSSSFGSILRSLSEQYDLVHIPTEKGCTITGRHSDLASGKVSVAYDVRQIIDLLGLTETGGLVDRVEMEANHTGYDALVVYVPGTHKVLLHAPWHCHYRVEALLTQDIFREEFQTTFELALEARRLKRDSEELQLVQHQVALGLALKNAHLTFSASSGLSRLYGRRGDIAAAEQAAAAALCGVSSEVEPSAVIKLQVELAHWTALLSLSTSNRRIHLDAEKMLERASELLEVGEYDEALQLGRESVEIHRRLLGDSDPSTLNAVRRLSISYNHAGQVSQEADTLSRLIDSERQVLGADHPQISFDLFMLACANENLNDLDAAYVNCQCAVDMIFKKKPLVLDFVTSRALLLLGRVCTMKGDLKSAFGNFHNAASAERHHLRDVAFGQSRNERLQSVARSRYFLDALLSSEPPGDGDSAAVYQEVLLWKGVVFRREFLDQKTGDAKQSNLRNKLYGLNSRIAGIVSSGNDVSVSDASESPSKRASTNLSEMIMERDGLEKFLSFRSFQFPDGDIAQDLEISELQGEYLPESFVLIDFIEYSHLDPPVISGEPWRHSERRIAAFVIPHWPSDWRTKEGEADWRVRRVELGSAELISDAFQLWRTHVATRAITPEFLESASVLRRLVWEPLEKQIGSAKTVLISPDGPICHIPFGALPGSENKGFLLEEFSFVVVPAPQAIGHMKYGNDRRGFQKNMTLVLVGDLDYGENESVAAVHEFDDATSHLVQERSAAVPQFKRLANTKVEIDAIHDLFSRQFPDSTVIKLTGAAGTQSTISEEASFSDWLHLATHGFFDPTGVRQNGLSVTCADLVSGIALSGANRPVPPGEDDGIMSAAEAQSLELNRLEMIVLSACETGLGEIVAGEGVFGLQRALQLAGARSSVTSLWTVDDHATSVLMIEFYKNYWQRKLSKVEALRQAQLSIMRQYDRTKKKLQPRGVRFVEGDAVEHDLASPYYWAPFVLSGDWQ